MNKIRVFKKSISYLIFCLILLAAALPIVSAVNTLTIRNRTEHQESLADQELEITIYGSHYMKQNTPFNFTNGLYTEFIYYGEGSILINASFILKTTSTHPISWNQIIAENFELPSEATGMAAISELNFGIGFFSYTLLIDGCGEFTGKHYEKTAFGICLGSNAFVIFQQ